MIDLNSKSAISDRINYLIDQKLENVSEKPRAYLGASIVGISCERAVQYHLLMSQGEKIEKKGIPGRTMRIFDRGFTYEEKAIKWLRMAGFVFGGNQVGIEDFDGLFKGHCDGIITDGPDVGLKLPCLWECKCLQDKSWKAIEKDGLQKYSSSYWAQAHLYMAYLELESCLYTVVNANTMELNHFVIKRDYEVARQYRDRVARILNASTMGEMVPRMTTDKNYYECKYCDFREECWK